MKTTTKRLKEIIKEEIMNLLSIKEGRIVPGLNRHAGPVLGIDVQTGEEVPVELGTSVEVVEMNHPFAIVQVKGQTLKLPMDNVSKG